MTRRGRRRRRRQCQARRRPWPRTHGTWRSALSAARAAVCAAVRAVAARCLGVDEATSLEVQGQVLTTAWGSSTGVGGARSTRMRLDARLTKRRSRRTVRSVLLAEPWTARRWGRTRACGRFGRRCSERGRRVRWRRWRQPWLLWRRRGPWQQRGRRGPWQERGQRKAARVDARDRSVAIAGRAWAAGVLALMQARWRARAQHVAR
mmetsp:Transcript_39336/g.86492  ORF Transcript_39336/g.86492 Transcript_39336/m.86492 type:complete len:206 (-) Transcript_39336:146-763(-)